MEQKCCVLQYKHHFGDQKCLRSTGIAPLGCSEFHARDGRMLRIPFSWWSGRWKWRQFHGLNHLACSEFHSRDDLGDKKQAILYYIIYYTILYYIILYYTILYVIILYDIMSYYIILYYMILYYIILYHTMLM